MDQLIIILAFNLFLFIPIHSVMLYFLYDLSFGKSSNPLNRIGFALLKQDREIFENERNFQIKQFKNWSLLLSFMLFFYINVSLYLADSDFSSDFISFLISWSFEISIILTTSVYMGYAIRHNLRSVELRSMIKVLETKDYNLGLLKNQVLNLTRYEKLKNIHFYILVRSFYKEYSQEFVAPHHMPRMALRSFSGVSSGEFIPNDYDELDNRTKRARTYINATFSTDLRITKLWTRDRTTMMYLITGLIGIPTSIFLMGIDSYLSNSEGSSDIFVVGFFWFITSIFMIIIPLRLLTVFERSMVDQTLTENGVIIENLTFKEEVDKLAELIEDKFPYISLE